MFFFGESQKNVLDCIKHSLFIRKGIITLSGLPGSGKTTVMRRAIEESIVPDTVICRINRARCSRFLDTLKREIFARHKKHAHTHPEAVSLHQLVAESVEERKHFLVVVDEAQQLTKEEVDELFSLVNIEKDSRKHFKFLLVSHQPFHEYFDVKQYTNSDKLLSNNCFLLPLLHDEILPYIEHRLTNTGWQGTPGFSKDIQQLVFLVTQGIPRRINSFFDRLLLFAYFEKNDDIDEAFVKRFCQDLLEELDAQSHPDLDSFDLRQALRRERRYFYPDFDGAEDDDKSQDIPDNAAEEDSAVSQLEEPLASDDPESLILFVSSFVKNPERYKNYTDQYYKLPQNLTLLLCLATETDQYIEDITPPELEACSATDIKCMIAVFIEKMLLTSRFDKHRVLGLDNAASEDEINRHFTYMMRLCRSEYVKSDKQKFEAEIKEAYIKLLSEHSVDEAEIPVVNEVLSSTDSSVDDVVFDKDAERKLADIEKAKQMLSHVGNEVNSNFIADVPESLIENDDKKSRRLLPFSIAGLAVAASIGYVVLGTSFFSPAPPESPSPQQHNIVSEAGSTLPEVAEKLPDSTYPDGAVVLKRLQEIEPKLRDKNRMPEVVESEPVVEDKSAELETISKANSIKATLPVAAKDAKPERVTKVEKAEKEQKAPNAKVLKASEPVKSVKNIVQTSTAPSAPSVRKENQQNAQTDNPKPQAKPKPDAVVKAVDKISREPVSPPRINIQSTPESEIERQVAKVISQLDPDVQEEVLNRTLAATRGVTTERPQGDGHFFEKRELDRIISNFKYSYENADIEELSTLFADNVVTNSGFNREQVLEDYETLFDESEMRSIQFSRISWDVSDGVATGSGHFVTRVEGDAQAEQKQGRLSIKVIDSEETKKITELFFLYQLAEIE